MCGSGNECYGEWVLKNSLFIPNSQNWGDRKCLGDPTKSIVGHPDAFLFLRISRKGVFQQPLAISPTISQVVRSIKGNVKKNTSPSSRVPGQLTGNFRGGDARRGVISEWPTGCVLEGLEWCWAEFDVGAKSQSRLTLTSVPLWCTA